MRYFSNRWLSVGSLFLIVGAGGALGILSLNAADLGSEQPSSPGQAAGEAGAATPTATPTGAAATVAPLEIKSNETGLGNFLSNAQGKALYVFLGDRLGISNCTGECAQTWQPLTTSGTLPSATGDVQSSLFGTITRDDGTQQITYNNLPLYYYALDTNPGDTNGHAVDSFGNMWYLVQSSGIPLIPPTEDNE